MFIQMYAFFFIIETREIWNVQILYVESLDLLGI